MKFYFYEGDSLREQEICFVGDADDMLNKDLHAKGTYVCGVQWSPDRVGKPIAITKPTKIVRNANVEPYISVRRSLKYNGYSNEIHYVITNDVHKSARALELLFDKLIEERIKYMELEISNFKEKAVKLKQRYGAKHV